MSREEPFFKKCCFCFPLKSCLQTWACVKSIADISISVFFTLMIILLSDSYYDQLTFENFTLVHGFIILTVILVVDSIFMVVLSIGLWTKNLRSLRIFYFYSFYMLVTGIIFVIAMAIYSSSETFYTAIEISVFVICGFINSVLDVCIIFTLKSEMIKLRNKQQYEFVKMPTLNRGAREVAEPAEPLHDDEENLNA